MIVKTATLKNFKGAWIPINSTEIRPPKNKSALCAYRFTDEPKSKKTTCIDIFESNREGGFGNKFFGRNIEILYWMPIPPIPKD